MSRHPNILLIHTHDQGDYLGCYGHPIQSPNLDRLAQDGVRFNQHFCCGTVCSPSRGSLMTGCYPHTHGLMGLVQMGWSLNTDQCPTLAMMLRDAGYHTHLFGFQHEHHNPLQLGYDRADEGPTYWCEDVAPLVVDWLGQHCDDNQPFFASVGFIDTHRTRNMDFVRDVYQQADPAKVLVRDDLPDLPIVREELSWLYGAVQHTDHCTGQILEALEQAGLTENTLVIFTTDHGASLMHAKGTLFDGGTKVAMIARWPKRIAANQVVEDLTSHVDVVPSLLQALGLPVGKHIQGRALPILSCQPDIPTRQYVYAENNFTDYYHPQRMVRNQRYKYICKQLNESFFDFLIPELRLSQTSFSRHPQMMRFYDCKRSREALYDLQKDAAELCNVANEPEYADALDTMRKRLDEQMAVTDDPFAQLGMTLPMPVDGYLDIRDRFESRNQQGKPAF